MLPALLTAAALAASPTGWHRPNSLVGVGVSPQGPSVRGEAWLATEITGELGVGLRDFDTERPMGDWALRWRPRFACFGCGERLLATLGVGVGGTVLPDLSGGPWGLGLGPDVVATGIWWASRSTGVQVSARAGFGPVVSTDGFEVDVVEPWFTLSAGLAF